ncbi:MAG: glycosyltransferase [Roseburia sp.]
MKTILLTGGGTASHVTPNLALIPSLKAAGYDIRYIGSYNGMERKLIENAGIPYDGISSGKLRRYFDLKELYRPVPRIKRLRGGR